MIRLFAVTAELLTTTLVEPAAIVTTPDGAETQTAGAPAFAQFEAVLNLVELNGTTAAIDVAPPVIKLTLFARKATVPPAGTLNAVKSGASKNP